MNPARFCRPILLLLASAAAVPAQPLFDHVKGNEIAGLTLDSINLTTCRVVHSCALPAPYTAHGAPLGGTVFDSVLGEEWTSDGTDIVRTRINCAADCFFTIPATMPRITGLGINKFRRYLYTAHTDNCIRIWDARTCQPPLLGLCRVNIPSFPVEMITGIEFDSRVSRTYADGRLFVVTGRNNLYVLEEPTPTHCVEICHLALPNCTANPIGGARGLTYNPGRRELIVTDGRNLLRVREASDCTLTLTSCCAVDGVASDLSGLAYYSGFIGPLVGLPCADGRCGCPPAIGALGFASISNPDFRIVLSNLAPGSVSVLALTLAPMLPTPLPFACGSIYVNPLPIWITLPIATSGGTQPCSWQGALPMGMFPATTGGLEFVVQAATLCPSSQGTGIGLSAALPFQIGW